MVRIFLPLVQSKRAGACLHDNIHVRPIEA